MDFIMNSSSFHDSDNTPVWLAFLIPTLNRNRKHIFQIVKATKNEQRAKNICMTVWDSSSIDSLLLHLYYAVSNLSAVVFYV